MLAHLVGIRSSGSTSAGTKVKALFAGFVRAHIRYFPWCCDVNMSKLQPEGAKKKKGKRGKKGKSTTSDGNGDWFGKDQAAYEKKMRRSRGLKHTGLFSKPRKNHHMMYSMLCAKFLKHLGDTLKFDKLQASKHLMHPINLKQVRSVFNQARQTPVPLLKAVRDKWFQPKSYKDVKALASGEPWNCTFIRPFNL